MHDRGIHSSLKKNIIQRVYGLPFVDGNQVVLLWKGRDSFRKIFNALRTAQYLICLEFYIFRNDETGTELAEILKQKAAEGVKVYILYDHFGSFGTPLRFWRDLQRSGIRIRASRPFKWTAPLHYVHRDHKKLIIIDGETAFTGGLNIANEYRGYHRSWKKKSWRDTGLLLKGPIAMNLLDSFKKVWTIWKGEPIVFRTTVQPLPDGLPALPIFASSAQGRKDMRKLLHYSINSSTRSIYLTTAYFTPSTVMIKALANAVQRGVSVKLLLPGTSDVKSAHFAGRAFFARLLQSGVKIYNYQGEILHAKTAVFDGLWSIIGSANLDFQSLRRNDEGNVGIIGTSFGTKMEQIFYEDLAISRRITADSWHKRPWYQKGLEQFFALFRKRL
jgi:cardiolipin synthase